jgi:hypothetical protein
VDADLAAAPDLANPQLLVLGSASVDAPPPTLLCAYRHHTGAAGGPRTFRIAVSASTDGGLTWAPRSLVTQGSLGAWEPFLFTLPPSDDGSTPVFNRTGSSYTVYVAYAAELPATGSPPRQEQDIVVRASTDGGFTWGPDELSRIHTPGSRNGMPGIAALSDGSLVAVFEGFWGPGGWGAYTVNSARSFDNGKTWPQRAVVHAPVNSSYNSGSPQVAACTGSGGTGSKSRTSTGTSSTSSTSTSTRAVACAVYMSDEPAASDVTLPAWPSGAHVAAQCAILDAANSSAPLVWDAAPVRTVATATPTAFWPGLVVDGTAPDEPLQVTYQDAHSGADVTTGPSLCFS